MSTAILKHKIRQPVLGVGGVCARRIHIHRRSQSVRSQPRDNSGQYEDRDASGNSSSSGLTTPRELVQYLNQFVIGQENAKKVLSVAVFNHYNRVRANLGLREPDGYGPRTEGPDPTTQPGVSPANVRPLRNRPTFSLFAQDRPPLFEKSNVLVIGPTGSGKTLLAKTLARVLDVPFSVSDATTFTQAGYIGEDVDMAIHRLLQAADYNPLRASTGIVYIDEIDKIARRSSSGGQSSRDVGGEGVQQALLRMLEGSTITIQAKGGWESSSPLSGGDQKGQKAAPQFVPSKSDTYHIDTSNVLFILSGAFVGLDKVIKDRTAKGSIGFTAPLSSEPFLPFFTSNGSTHSSNPLDQVETADLVKFGFIPEFISRLPTITTLAPLTIPDLRRILTEVKGSLVAQYQALFSYSGVELRFTSMALDEICKKAYDRGGGARGLRGIMESLLLEPMYEVPGSDVYHVLITADVVKGTARAGYWKAGEAGQFWEAWANEEGTSKPAKKASAAG